MTSYFDAFAPYLIGTGANLALDVFDYSRQAVQEQITRKNHRRLNQRYRNREISYGKYIRGVRHTYRDFNRYHRNFRSARAYLNYGTQGPFVSISRNLLWTWRSRKAGSGRQRRRAVAALNVFADRLGVAWPQ